MARKVQATEVVTGDPVVIGQILELDPDNILIDEELRAIRDWTGSSRQEISIKALAEMIRDEGQLQPALVRETAEGYMLVAGHRRREAIKYLREDGQPDAMLQCMVDIDCRDENAALRKAGLENIQREDFTAIEKGKLFRAVRKRFGWEGKEGTAEVAAFYGVSPATVTQMEKLLSAPEEILARVRDGGLTASAALQLMSESVKPDKRVEVADTAKRVAREDEEKKDRQRGERLEKAEEAARRNPTPQMKRSAAAMRQEIKRAKEEKDRREAEAKSKGKAEAEPVVTSKHVREAAKKVRGAGTGKMQAPRIGEAAALFEQWGPSAYPKVMADFSACFLEWAKGHKSDKHLTSAWDDIADKLPAAKAAKGNKVAKPVAKPVAAADKKSAKPSIKAKGKAQIKAKR